MNGYKYEDFKISFTDKGFYIYTIHCGNYIYLNKNGLLCAAPLTNDIYFNTREEAKLLLKTKFNIDDNMKNENEIQKLINLCNETNVIVSLGDNIITLFDNDTEFQTEIPSIEVLMKYLNVKKQYKNDIESFNLNWV